MKLWLLLWREIESDWDTAQGFVVRAGSARAARRLADGKAGDENYGGEHPWLNPKETTCVQLKSQGTPGVIMRDFNAG
jgi:hypothetical protein